MQIVEVALEPCEAPFEIACLCLFKWSEEYIELNGVFWFVAARFGCSPCTRAVFIRILWNIVASGLRWQNGVHPIVLHQWLVGPLHYSRLNQTILARAHLSANARCVWVASNGRRTTTTTKAGCFKWSAVPNDYLFIPYPVYCVGPSYE